MTSEIFSSWLIRLDRRFLRMEKKVALVLDNASCHPQSVQSVLKSIKLIFLPPNTTSMIQPMDQGIIADFKKKFMHLYVTDTLIENKPWDILKACHTVAAAWSNVLPQSISNSFRHCGFTHTPAPPAELDEDDIPLAQLIRSSAPTITPDELDAFLHADDNLLTCAPYEIEDVVQTITAQESSDESDSEDLPESPTWGDVAEAVHTMKTFFVHQNRANGVGWEHLCKAENEARRLFLNSMKQKTITSFFK